MTCIIAIKSNNKVYVGCDIADDEFSQAVSGPFTVKSI